MPFVLGIPFYFYEENTLEKLWVPDDSRAYLDKAWTDKTFTEKLRQNLIIIVADNVLEPEVIQQVYNKRRMWLPEVTVKLIWQF